MIDEGDWMGAGMERGEAMMDGQRDVMKLKTLPVGPVYLRGLVLARGRQGGSVCVWVRVLV